MSVEASGTKVRLGVGDGLEHDGAGVTLVQVDASTTACDRSEPYRRASVGSITSAYRSPREQISHLALLQEAVNRRSVSCTMWRDPGCLGLTTGVERRT